MTSDRIAYGPRAAFKGTVAPHGTYCLNMVDYENWISQLNDDTKLGTLAIPGTHNSAACKTALPSVQCQGATIAEQLNNGVRFLDFRVGKYPLKSGDAANELTVCHGNFPISLPFPTKLSNALKEVYEWQDAHSNEVIIVSIKAEGTPAFDIDSNEFPPVFQKYLDEADGRWYLGDSLPRLGDIRGKLVLFRRYTVKDDKYAVGFPANSWAYNTEEQDRGNFVVQDFCEVGGQEDLDKKIQCIKNFAQNAGQYNSTNADGKLFVNFTSASNFFSPDCWPQKIAEALANEGLDADLGKGTGITVLDYAETDNWKITHKIVESNF